MITGLFAATAWIIGIALPLTIIAVGVAARAGHFRATPWATGAVCSLFLVALPATGFIAAFASAGDDSESLPMLGGLFTALLGLLSTAFSIVLITVIEAVMRRRRCADVATGR